MDVKLRRYGIGMLGALLALSACGSFDADDTREAESAQAASKGGKGGGKKPTCSVNNGGCSPNATCSMNKKNTNVMCTCNTGYAGDGRTCTDINECLTNNGGCSANATCTNTPGSRTCTCNSGYTGDGIACTPGTGGSSDSIAPKLTALSVTPPAVDSTHGSAQIQITATFQDDLAGFAGGSQVGYVTLWSPSGQQSGCGLNKTDPGTSLQVSVACAATIHQFAESGDWTLSVNVNDRVGNLRGYGPMQLDALGFPSKVTVVSQSDSTAPVLEVLSVDPTSVNVGDAPAQVQINAVFRDDLAGFAGGSQVGYVTLWSPSGQQSGCGLNKVDPGTSLQVTVSCVATIPQFSESGDWVISINVNDRVGNLRGYGPMQLDTLGFPSKVTVVSQSDSTAPVLEVLSVNPTYVNVGDAPAQVQISAVIRDDLAGFAGGSQVGYVTLWSPSGQQSGCGLNKVDPGTSLQVTVSCTATILQFAESGNWAISVNVNDRVGNLRGYGPTQLDALGFSSNVNVASSPMAP